MATGSLLFLLKVCMLSSLRTLDFSFQLDPLLLMLGNKVGLLYLSKGRESRGGFYMPMSFPVVRKIKRKC